MSCEVRPGWVPGQTPQGKAGEPVDAEKRPELIEQMEALGKEIEFLAARLSVLGGRLEEVMRPAPSTEEGEEDLVSPPCSPAAQQLRSLRCGVIGLGLSLMRLGGREAAGITTITAAARSRKVRP